AQAASQLNLRTTVMRPQLSMLSRFLKLHLATARGSAGPAHDTPLERTPSTPGSVFESVQRAICFDPLSQPLLSSPKMLPWVPLTFRLMYSSGWQTFPRRPMMVNTTDICRRAISIGILMTLSSSVPQTTREKVYIETVYADRVENVYSDRIAKHTDR